MLDFVSHLVLYLIEIIAVSVLVLCVWALVQSVI
jgi:hypothetical protein